MMALHLSFLSIFLISFAVVGGKSETSFSPRIKKKKQEMLCLPKGSELIAECLRPEIDLSSVHSLINENLLIKFKPLSKEEIDAQMLPVPQPIQEVTASKSKKRKKRLRLHRQKSLEAITPQHTDALIKLSSYWSDAAIPNGATALHIAVIRNENRLIEVLLNSGNYHQLLAQDENDNTPLHLAIKLDHGPFDTIMNGSLEGSEQGCYQSFLLEASTKFNNRGYAVLHLAINFEESLSYVMKLLEIGVSPNLFSRQEHAKAPIEMAKKKEKHLEAILLVLYGANPSRLNELFEAELALLRQEIFKEKIQITEWLKAQKNVGPGFLDFYQKGMAFTQKVVAPIKTEQTGPVVEFRYQKPLGQRPTVKSLPLGCHTLKYIDHDTTKDD